MIKSGFEKWKILKFVVLILLRVFFFFCVLSFIVYLEWFIKMM